MCNNSLNSIITDFVTLLCGKRSPRGEKKRKEKKHKKKSQSNQNESEISEENDIANAATQVKFALGMRSGFWYYLK